MRKRANPVARDDIKRRKTLRQILKGGEMERRRESRARKQEVPQNADYGGEKLGVVGYGTTIGFETVKKQKK